MGAAEPGIPPKPDLSAVYAMVIAAGRHEYPTRPSPSPRDLRPRGAHRSLGTASLEPGPHEALPFGFGVCQGFLRGSWPAEQAA